MQSLENYAADIRGMASAPNYLLMFTYIYPELIYSLRLAFWIISGHIFPVDDACGCQGPAVIDIDIFLILP